MTQKVKYPGTLGKRSNDMPPVPPPTTILGEPNAVSKEQYEREKQEWVLRQAIRSFEGIKLLLEHYEIDDTENRYFHLAMALARDHVPHLMEPVRRKGRPTSTLTKLLPAIDATSKMMKQSGRPQSEVYDTFAAMLNVKPETIKREIKRFRQQSDGGEKLK